MPMHASELLTSLPFGPYSLPFTLSVTINLFTFSSSKKQAPWLDHHNHHLHLALPVQQCSSLTAPPSPLNLSPRSKQHGFVALLLPPRRQQLPSSGGLHNNSNILNVISKEQALHTAERLAGMSRGEIQHIFEDLDADGS